MKQFHEMLRTVTSSAQHDQMLRFAAPLSHLGVSHFWYYKITFSGDYSYLGTHSAWNEFCIDRAMVKHFPCLRHPEALQTGINLMKLTADNDYKAVLDIAWDKFHINLGINLISSIPEGIEAFGFGSYFNDPFAEQRLLNELPLLRYFIKLFRAKHKKLFYILDDNQVNLPSHFGHVFYERPKTLVSMHNRDKFLRKLGFESILTLTRREIDVLKYIASGFPASYIANQLGLCSRTVENYIATIKGKLSCNSKVELIRKAQEIGSTGFFD